MFNLKQKLMFIAILPVVLTLSMIVVAAESVGKKLAYDNFEQKAAAQFQSVAGVLESLFKSHVRALELIASSEFVRSGNDEDRLAFLRKQYRFFRDQHIESLYLTTISGRVDGIFGETFYVGDRDYYPSLLAGKTVMTPIQKSRATQKPIILFIVPIFNQKNEVVGGIGSTIPVKELAKLIIDAVPKEAEFAILLNINTEQILIATSGDSDALAFRPIDDFKNDKDTGSLARLAAGMVELAQGMAELSYNGQEYVSYFSNLPGLLWSLALNYPQDNVLSLIRRIRNYSLLTLMISMVFVLFSTWLLFRHVLSPIRQIGRGFAELRRGNLHAFVPTTKRTDEIAKLSEDFNATVRDFRNSFEDREKAISDKEDLLRIVETTPDYIAIANAAWRIIYFNPAAADMIQHANQEIESMSIPDFFTPEYRGIIIEKAVPQALRTGIWEGETEVSDKYGELIALSEVVMCHHRRDGSYFFSMTARNISRLKKEERERALAKERMEAAMRSQTVFLSTVSHELMTPLTGIVSGLESFDQMAIGEDERKLLTITKRSALKLHNILLRIILFVDVVSGKVRTSTEYFRLDEALMAAVTPLIDRIQEKGLKLKWEISEHVIMSCRGDQRLIQEIILTLVDNAVKFTMEGEIKVTVDKIKQKSHMQILEIKVIDNGIGISRENWEKIFDPFYQIDAALTREYEGVGLGLAYCKELVRMLNGMITVDSELGRGSRFSVVFPLEMAEGSEPR